MLRLALRGLLARKLRAALTGLAVVLGVAFIAGTLVFTDTIDASFKDLFERIAKGTDVQVTSRDAVDDFFSQPAPFDAAVLDRVKGVDGVDAAEGDIDGQVAVFKNGKRFGNEHGGPGVLATSGSERFDPLEYVEGERITDRGKVAIDEATAKREGVQVGDTVTLSGEQRTKDYRVGAIVKIGGQKSLGVVLAVVTLPEGQLLTGREGKLDTISIAAKGGVSADRLKRRVQAVVGDLRVETGKESADRQAAEIGDQLSFLDIALLVFAGVAVLVGGFLIFNTFSITVAQRQRELAMLRTIGASRRQVLQDITLEAALIGAAASVIGLLAGLAVAPLLRSLLAGFGIELPNTGTVIETRTVIVALVLGLGVTVIAALVPARRATRVDPLAALRDAEAPTGVRVGRRRVVVSLALLGVALVIELIGLFGGGDAAATASLLGLGAVLAIFAVALISPVLVRPLARFAGAPLRRWGGLPGRLAQENSTRQPQRTAVTASALMIGLALVVFVTVFAAGIKKSIDDAIGDTVRAQTVILNKDGFSPLPPAVAQALRDSGDFDTVSTMRYASAKTAKGNTFISGVDPKTLNAAIAVEFRQGTPQTLTALADDHAIVEEGFADKRHLQVGDSFALTAPSGEKRSFTVDGTFKNRVGTFGDVLLTNATVQRMFHVLGDAFILALGKGDDEALKRKGEALVKDQPSAEVFTRQGYTDDQAEQVNQLVGLFYALLALSVIVSLLGIVNTLALAVHERTRELGMLRAVGMSRAQVRAMVRREAVITALIGAVLGLALGTAFAALVSRPLADEGFVLTIPIATLIGLALFAALAGWLAAVHPARRASRVDVLRAVAAE